MSDDSDKKNEGGSGTEKLFKAAAKRSDAAEQTKIIKPVKPSKKKAKSGASSKKSTSKKAAAKKVTKRPRTFPLVSLERAVQVAYKIKEKNGGNPWATPDVAEALGSTPKSSEFFYVTAASRDFGLTIGTRETAEISLTDLGRELVYADNPEKEHAKKREAFFNIDLFKQVLAYYNGTNLPEMKYLANTLESKFNVDPAHHDEFAKAFLENANYLGITSADVAATGPHKSGPATVVVGSPKKDTGLKAFVIMPFWERTPERPKGFFSEVLRSLITPAGLEAGFSVETANREGSDVIQSTIVNDLLEADLVICDLTDHNPNVLFELGLRMAEDKPVALIKAVGTGKVFDVDNMLRVLEYQPNLWKTTIEADVPHLTKHFKAAWDNKDTNISYLTLLRRQKLEGG